MKKKFLIIMSILMLVVVTPLGITALGGLQHHYGLIQRIAGIDITPANSNPVYFPHPILSSPRRPGVSPSGMPYVQGTQILDGSGHSLLLRGAQIESPFNYMKSWQSGTEPSKYLNSSVFYAMVHGWKMNVLRLPISNWIYAKDSVNYMRQLDQVIQQANAADLYVILDLHDDGKAGSPYADNADLPKVENIAFWKAIASHYKNNPMVMFDLYNEPKATNWSMWLHGGGTFGGARVVGFQDLVNAIRSVGAKQVIVVEPGAAGSGQSGATRVNGAEEGGWSTVGNNTIKDPNIVYSLHVYDGILMTPQKQDAKWGPILNHHPIYYGEWALVTNGYGLSGQAHCKNVVHDQADQDVTNFLNYMSSRHANWTAWAFTPYHLIQDYTNFTPTTLDMPWTCGDSNGHAGMGTLVKQYLTSN